MKHNDKNFNKMIMVLDRAEQENIVYNSRFTLAMDLEYANKEIPIDFDKLWAFDSFDFKHDIRGIQSNINRATGKIENCFVPRCAI